ncbi:MAG TPA: hypothetical protein VFS40_05610, partial [Gemmatimonadales bacterium]|nr:hypothetical protein [Gemmatimonadales bacterium]
RAWSLHSSYTWARTWREAGASRYPADFDMPQRLKLLLAYEPEAGWFASADATLASGLPYTPYTFTYSTDYYDPYKGFIIPPFGSGAVVLQGPRNAARLPMTHRVDVRVGYRKGHTGSGLHWEAFVALADLTRGQSIPIQPRRTPVPPGSPDVIVSYKTRYAIPLIPILGLRLEL